MKKKNKLWGTTSLITSILGALLFLTPYFGLPLSIFAIMSSYQQNKIEKNGMSQAGLVMGIIGIVMNGMMIILLILMLSAMSLAGTIFQ